MATLTFTVTATEAEFDDFANRLGYMADIIQSDNSVIPNPETRTQFLLRTMEEAVAERFYVPFVRDIETQVRDTMETEKETMRQVVRDRVTAQFTA